MHDRLDKARADGLKIEDEYTKLCLEKQKTYPMLAVYTAAPDAANQLARLDVDKKGIGGLANEIHDVAQDKLDDIKTVRAELGQGITVWKEPHMLAITKEQLKAASWQSRVADEYAATVQAKDADRLRR